MTLLAPHIPSLLSNIPELTSEKSCGFLHRTEAIDVFTLSDKLLSVVGSVPTRAGTSDEIPIDNTFPVTRGRLVKHLAAFVGTAFFRGRKEQAHEKKAS